MGAEVRFVTDSIVCVTRASYLTCSYLVRTAAGIVVVDAGMDSDGADVRRGLEALGAEVDSVRGILLTHWHNDRDVLFGDFEVVATPGHTPGHVSYFYRPERALFAGDALAVIGGELRFMARPVTPDLTSARASVAKCLSVNPAMICPGHREPLTVNVEQACTSMRARLGAEAPWPLFG